MQTSKNTPANTTLVLNTKKVYTPAANTAQNNQQSWAAIQAALKAGPQTRAQLTAMLATQYNHAPFVGYAIRRGWLVAGPATPAKATKAKAKAAK